MPGETWYRYSIMKKLQIFYTGIEQNFVGKITELWSMNMVSN